MQLEAQVATACRKAALAGLAIQAVYRSSHALAQCFDLLVDYLPDIEGHLKAYDQNALIQLLGPLSERVLPIVLHHRESNVSISQQVYCDAKRCASASHFDEWQQC